MGELISGKEALIALANGGEVECRAYEKNWINASNKHHPLSLFFDDSFQFRLKPRTVNLNGVEMPSVKYVAHSGGNCVKISCESPEDAAAVSAALRSVFGKK